MPGPLKVNCGQSWYQAELEVLVAGMLSSQKQSKGCLALLTVILGGRGCPRGSVCVLMHFSTVFWLMSEKASNTEQGRVKCEVSPHHSAPAPPKTCSCSHPGEALTLSNGISCQAVLFDV